MDKQKKFSQVLREARNLLALTQEEMAYKLGIKSRMYVAYEAGEYDNSKGDARRAKHLQKIQGLLERVNVKENPNLFSPENNSLPLSFKATQEDTPFPNAKDEFIRQLLSHIDSQDELIQQLLSQLKEKTDVRTSKSAGR